ncbi:MAG: MBL fold metallo-hydrolase [Candidatus Omnitrophica bacterium]|nr:MBL fold metallo-hydrolase [Candidatus Omnitrophota bacterium]
MELIIHRGTKEIGGSCVELISGKSRIIVDVGMPLVNDKKEPFDSRLLKDKSLDDLKKLKLLPSVSGLYTDESRAIDAVLISHSHLDHYGFLKYINPNIPIYMSEGAKQLIKISDIFTPNKIGPINPMVLEKDKQVKIGNFLITPYLVDHSAFDARAFLIEADSKRLFYSGDFRGHGRKNVLFKEMIDNPPEDIDCLLMEGSMLGRSEQVYENEEKVQNKISKILRKHKNITFLFTSTQNIDRLVSAYKACLRTDSILVIDIYTAFVLDNLRKVSVNIPQFNWKNIRIKFLKNHADAMADSGHGDLLITYNRRKIDMIEINKNKNKILMMARDNSVFPHIVKNIDNIEGATIVYSLWEGYLTDKFKNYCKEKGITIEQVHTSGHAIVEDLKTFAEALNPKTLIPIHTFEGDSYPELFKNTTILEDGKIFEVN